MKKLTILLAFLIIMISPAIVNAQPSGNKWVNLRDYLHNNYTKSGRDEYKPKDSNSAKFVTKLAYKKNSNNEIIARNNFGINQNRERNSM